MECNWHNGSIWDGTCRFIWEINCIKTILLERSCFWVKLNLPFIDIRHLQNTRRNLPPTHLRRPKTPPITRMNINRHHFLIKTLNNIKMPPQILSTKVEINNHLIHILRQLNRQILPSTILKFIELYRYRLPMQSPTFNSILHCMECISVVSLRILHNANFRSEIVDSSIGGAYRTCRFWTTILIVWHGVLRCYITAYLIRIRHSNIQKSIRLI